MRHPIETVPIGDDWRPALTAEEATPGAADRVYYLFAAVELGGEVHDLTVPVVGTGAVRPWLRWLEDADDVLTVRLARSDISRVPDAQLGRLH